MWEVIESKKLNFEEYQIFQSTFCVHENPKNGIPFENEGMKISIDSHFQWEKMDTNPWNEWKDWEH